MKWTAYLSAIALAFGTVTGASGQTVFSDSFATNGTLVGLSPQVGGAWDQTGTVATNPLAVSGGAVAMTTGQDAYGSFSAAVPTTAGTSIFTGVDINVTAASSGGDYFLHLSDPVATTSNFYQRVFIRSSGAGFQVGLASHSGTGATTTYGTDVLNFGQSYRVVIAWDFVAGAANDIFNVYVNPTDPNQANNTAAVANYIWTGSPEPTANVSAVNLRQGGGTTAPTLSLDNLVVTTTFATAAVPEPTLVGLAAVAGFAGMARLRRRRQVIVGA